MFGCPLGAFLFSLALRRPAEYVLNMARSVDPTADLLFYLDDGYLVMDADRLMDVLALLAQSFACVGLTLNESKIAIWARDRSTLPERHQSVWQVVASVRSMIRRAGCPGCSGVAHLC